MANPPKVERLEKLQPVSLRRIPALKTKKSMKTASRAHILVRNLERLDLRSFRCAIGFSLARLLGLEARASVHLTARVGSRGPGGPTVEPRSKPIGAKMVPG